MDALLQKLESSAQADQSEAWQRYRELLSGEDASDDAAIDLKSIMRSLGLSTADVKKHAAALAEAKRLVTAEAGLEEAKREYARVHPLLAATRIEVEKAKKAADERFREAMRADMGASNRVNNAVASGERLRAIRTQYAFLFSAADRPGAGAPATIRYSMDLPATIDERLLSLEPERGYTTEELTEAGLAASDLANAQWRIPKSPDGLFHGSTVIEWARENRKMIRARRRSAIPKEMLPIKNDVLTIPDGEIVGTHDLFKFGISRVVRRDRSFPRADATTFGHWNGFTIRKWALAARARNDRLQKELAELDALDRSESVEAGSTIVATRPPEEAPAAAEPPAVPLPEHPDTQAAAVEAPASDFLADLDMREESRPNPPSTPRRSKPR